MELASSAAMMLDGAPLLAALLVRRVSTDREHVLEHPVRARIIELLRAHPMSTKTAVRKGIACAWGTIHHHLNVLERDNLIKSIRVGRSERYFLPEARRDEVEPIGALRRGRAQELADHIMRNPGTAQNELTSQLDMSRKMVRAYVDRLTKVGLVTENRQGRYLVYHPSEKLAGLLAQARGNVGRADDPPAEAPQFTPDFPPPV